MQKLTTRLLLTCAAIGAVFGVVAIGATYLMAAVAAAAPAFAVVISGYFLMPGVIAQGLLRQPGVALLTHLFAALIALPFSPPGYAAGPVLLATGALLEIGAAVTAYRYWKWWTPYLVALVFAAASAVSTIAVLDLGSSPRWVVFVVPSLLVLTSVTFVKIARAVAAAIERTGVSAGLTRRIDERARVVTDGKQDPVSATIS